MEEGHKKNLRSAVKIQLDKYPLLSKLVNNPTHYLQSPWTQLVSQQLHSQFGARSDVDLYRIVYSPGASGELMTIQKGVLAGLNTTSVVGEDGRITSSAALEKVDGQIDQNLLPMLLTMGALNSIHDRLSYITGICTDIRNRQISGDKAKLERISEVIVDCFEGMSESDERFNEDNLRRVTKNTDDCFEILSVFLDDLNAQHKAKEMDFHSFDEHANVVGRRHLARPTAAIRELMNHSVFAAYERYAAGRACQVVLSGNYSTSNIERHKRALGRVRDSIRKIFDERMERHHRGAEFLLQIIEELNCGYVNYNWTVESAQSSLKQQRRVIEELERRLYELLDARIADFDALAQMFSKGKFEIIVIDGGMFFCEADIPALESEKETSSKVLPIKEKIT